MKQITMYECPHCKGIFRTPNRHVCRKRPELKNCYSCAHWNHQFVIGKGDQLSCKPEDACEVSGYYSDDAFEVMRNNGWLLNCLNWKGVDQGDGK